MGSMRDSDRFWWAMLLAGLAFGIASVILPWYFWNQFSADEPYTTPTDYAMCIFLGLICLGGAAMVFFRTAQARGRHQKRAAALRGDLSGMPLATIQPDPAQAPDVSAQPLEVMWRMSGPSAIVGRVFLVPYFLIAFIGVVGAFLYFGIAPIFVPSMRSRPMSPSEMAMSAVISCGVIAVIAGLGWYAGRMVPILFGRPFGVRATAEGIECRTNSGVRSFIVWDEVRLFEVIGPQGNALRSFALYAPSKSVIWRDYWTGVGSEYAPAGATGIENAQRLAALLNLVTARTGLEPRTLAKSLRRDLIGVPASAWQINALASAIFALFFWALAIGEYRFPITPYPWANWPSVAALGILAVFLTVLTAMTALRRRRAAIDGPPAVAAPSLDSPNSAYSLSWRVPEPRRRHRQ